jgi:hypothetical protein
MDAASRAELLAWGDEAQGGYPPVTATAFMAYARNGDRQISEQPYFARRSRLIGAVLAECTANDGRYLDAIIDGLWCICEESTWVLSAHNGDDHPGMRPVAERPLPDVQNPYVDLFSAQTAAALAIILYMMEDKLEAITPLIARRVRLEIHRRVLEPFRTHDDFWWMGFYRKDLNNWTPWILSNVIDCLLLSQSDHTLRAEGIARALRMLDRFLDCVPPDGGCEEGPMYWNYAGASVLDCLESLHYASEGRISFYEEPLIRAMGAFPLMAHIAGGYYLNFSDCDALPDLDGERIHRFGLRTQNPALAALGWRAHQAQPSRVRRGGTQMNRVLFSLFSDIGEPPVSDPEPDGHFFLPDTQWYAWRREGLYAAIRGGHNGVSHNHNDLGSFMIYFQGQPHFIDAGNLTYSGKTFSAERYTLWNNRAAYHNIPLIGGMEQAAGAEYRAQTLRADEKGIALLLQDAYPEAAQVRRYRREMLVQPGAVDLIDHIDLAAPQEITWVFMLAQKPRLSRGECAIGGLILSFDPALTPAIEEIPMTDPRMSKSFPRPLWRLMLTAAPLDRHDQAFTIAPGGQMHAYMD